MKKLFFSTLVLGSLFYFGSCQKKEGQQQTKETQSEQKNSGQKSQSGFVLNNNFSVLGTAFDVPGNWGVVSGSAGHTFSDIYADDWNFHTGGNSDAGKPLNAVLSGTVIYVRSSGYNGDNPTMSTFSYGNQVIIQSACDPNFVVRYAHLQDVNVETGQFVSIGENIGTCGYSGLSGTLINGVYYTAHLHLVLYKNVYGAHGNGTALQTLKNGGFIANSSFAAPFKLLNSVPTEPCVQSAPGLLSPENNYADQSNPVNFEWENMGANSIYRIQVSRSLSDWSENGFAENSNLVLNQNTGSSNSFTWSGAAENATYYWSVKTHKDGVSSKYSQPFKFVSVADYNISPVKNTYTNCPTNDVTGDCSSNPYLGETIKATVSSVTPSSIKFKIKKCNGTFSSDGYAYIKSDGVCGDVVNSVRYAAGSSEATIVVPNDLSIGDTRSFYGIVISDVNPQNNRFHALPITISKQ